MDDVVIVTFDELSQARAASTELGRLADLDLIAIRSGALVVRDPDGGFRIPETETSGITQVGSGNALGELLGALEGPVASLSRYAGVLMARPATDGQADEIPERILASVARRVPPGMTALVADIDEPFPRALDSAIGESGGSVTRRLRADIEAELAATRHVLVRPDEPPTAGKS